MLQTIVELRQRSSYCSYLWSSGKYECKGKWYIWHPVFSQPASPDSLLSIRFLLVNLCRAIKHVFYCKCVHLALNRVFPVWMSELLCTHITIFPNGPSIPSPSPLIVVHKHTRAPNQNPVFLLKIIHLLYFTQVLTIQGATSAMLCRWAVLISSFLYACCCYFWNNRHDLVPGDMSGLVWLQWRTTVWTGWQIIWLTQPVVVAVIGNPVCLV